MPVRYSWMNEAHTIVKYDFEHIWSWQEAHAIFDEVRGQIIDLGHRVDVILDMRNSARLPPDALSNVRQVATQRPRNGGIIVVIGANQLLPLYATFQNVYRAFRHILRIRFVASLEEALTVIAEENKGTS